MKFDNYLKALRPTLDVLNSVNNTLNLPRMISINALTLYKQCINKKMTRGRRREALMSACIYISCQLINYPINLKRLCKASDVSLKELIRNKKFIKHFIKVNEQGISAEQFIKNYCYELGLSEQVITKSLSNLKGLRLNKLSKSRAVTAIYLTGKTSIRKLAKVSGLSKTHIHECIKITRALNNK